MSAPRPKNETKRIEALRRYHILDTPAEQAFDDFTFLASTASASRLDGTGALVWRQFGEARVKNENGRGRFCKRLVAECHLRR